MCGACRPELLTLAARLSAIGDEEKATDALTMTRNKLWELVPQRAGRVALVRVVAMYLLDCQQQALQIQIHAFLGVGYEPGDATLGTIGQPDLVRRQRCRL